MKVPLNGVWLLSALLALALSGCSLFGSKVVHRSDSVTIRRTEWKGWRDCYVITNGEVEVVVVPQIARIMKYGIAGGKNMLWVNEELTPEKAPEAHAPEPGEWLNYGGYKLWPAPQRDWNWPPDWTLDRGPCTVEVTEEGALHLVGMASEKHGIRFDRQITLAPTGGRLDLVQTAVNVSGEPGTVSIWDVTQVNDDCVAFVPLGPGASYRTLEGDPLDEQWTRTGDMLLCKPAGRTGKVFISGPPPWLGCRQGPLLFIKAFEMAEEPPPEPETPREVYTGDSGYIELEIVGPAVRLEPGESTALNQVWTLRPASPNAQTDEGLIRNARAEAALLLGE
jgi:hypothetical protein